LDKSLKSRREFLMSGSTVISASWLALNTPLILAASQSAQTNSKNQAAYLNISNQDALEFGAIVDQIIPPDETPGATEAGVVYFIDAALGGFMAGVAPMFQEGLQDLQERSNSAGRSNSRFSELSFEKQTEVLKEIDETGFFNTIRTMTLMGMFCLPQYGGNRDNIGWDLIGFSHQHVWQPPFGYYDAEAHGQVVEPGGEHGNS
jgi:gluconate 2-dehydrogenase gamma chain